MCDSGQGIEAEALDIVLAATLRVIAAGMAV
jgi:hypothetical protein